MSETLEVQGGDSVRLSCLLDGPDDGVAVLLCHSIGTSCRLWAPQVERLARAWRVIRFDARGHGRSSAPAGEYSIDDLGRDALAVVDAVAAPAAHIVGLSMGGLVAMWMGINAPGRVTSLVLAHTAARLGTEKRWTDRIAAVRAGGMQAVADTATSAWFSAGFVERSPATVQRFQRELLATSPEGYAGCCAALRDADLSASIGTIRAPTLVISGTADTATPAADGEALRAGIPHATLATIDAAHLGNVERPEEFTTLVESFLAENRRA
jgi:3-oxoadipate enol-lactonase